MEIKVCVEKQVLELKPSSAREEKALERFFGDAQPESVFRFKLEVKTGRVRWLRIAKEGGEKITIKPPRGEWTYSDSALGELFGFGRQISEPYLVFYSRREGSVFLRYTSAHDYHSVRFDRYLPKCDSLTEGKFHPRLPQIEAWPSPVFTRERYEIALSFYLPSSAKGEDTVRIDFHSCLSLMEGDFDPWVEIRCYGDYYQYDQQKTVAKLKGLVEEFKRGLPSEISLSRLFTKEAEVFRANINLPANEAEFLGIAIGAVKKMAQRLNIPLRWIRLFDFVRQKTCYEDHGTREYLEAYLRTHHGIGHDGAK